MKKSTKKVKATRNKTINNTIKKEGVGFNSLEIAPRERNNTKGSSRTPLKNIKKLNAIRKKTINNTT
jgi:hypothetical protein